MARFGELLSELRQDHKMTQKELARKLHVTDGTISNYENGVHLPDVEKLSFIADIFGVTTDYLLGRCQSNQSPDVFERLVIDNKTVGSLIDDISSLSPDRKRVLALVIKDMKFSMVIGQYNTKEKP